MERSVSIYALVRIDVPHTKGITEDDVIANAVTATDLPPGFCGFVRYEMEGPHGTIHFHDKKHLDRLHEQRLDQALVFDLDEHIEDTTAAYLDRDNLKAKKEGETATSGWNLQTGEFRCSLFETCSHRNTRCPPFNPGFVPDRNQDGAPLWMTGTCKDLGRKLCGLVFFFLLPFSHTQALDISQYTSFRPAPITFEVPFDRTRRARRLAFA
jgi:hypothetical protein